MQKQGQMQNLLCVYEFICMKMEKKADKFICGSSLL